MQQEIVNLHKEFRRNIMTTSFTNPVNKIVTMSKLAHSLDKEHEDYDVILKLTDYTADVIHNADAKLKDTILGILVVDNYKYLYKSFQKLEFDDEEFDHLVLYKKLDDLNLLKEKLKKDDDFFVAVLRNVIDLYYMTAEEEYYFLQDGIKKTNMEEKLSKVDPTYVFDKLQYSELPNYNLKSLLERYNSKYNDIENDFSSANICKDVISEQLFNSLALLSTYNLELFNQNLYEIIITNYNHKREEVKTKEIKNVPKKDLLFMYQVENTSILKMIDSFFANKEEIVDMMSDYLLKEKEKIKQKNPNQ